MVQHSPPLLDLEEEVTPLLAEEARPRTLEDPSPTLIITDMLGDLTPEVEVVESPEGKRK